MSASWELAPLRELLDVQNGYAFDAKKFTAENGVPLIRIRDLKEGDGTETNYTGQFDRDYLVSEGDLLIGMDGEFRCYEWKGPPSLLNQRVCRLRNFNDKLEPRFLYYGINKYLEEIEDATSYTTVKHLSSKTILGIEFPHPPLPEQQRIVGKLDAAFAALAEALAHVERNRANARELFESYLNGVFEGKGDGWVEKTLQEVCEKITDGTHQTPTYFDDGVVFLSSRNVTSGKIDWDNIKYIDAEQHREMHKRVAPRRGDILLAKNGTTGVAAIVDRDTTFDIYVSLAHLRALPLLRPRFLLHFINSPAAKVQFNKRLKGIGVPNLHLNEIREVLISFPTKLEAQDQIISELDRLDNETRHLETTYQQKLSDLAGLKKAVLGAAFRGEL